MCLYSGTPGERPMERAATCVCTVEPLVRDHPFLRPLVWNLSLQVHNSMSMNQSLRTTLYQDRLCWVSNADLKAAFLNLGRLGGAGIAQWLEHRTRDWKVAGSNPCWNGGRIFFSRVDFLCWLLFRYPFHPRVTTVARKKSRSFCQKCRWQVTAKHAYTLRMWLLLNRASALVTTCP